VLFKLPVVDIQKEVENYLVDNNQHLCSMTEYNRGMIENIKDRKYLDTKVKDKEGIIEVQSFYKYVNKYLSTIGYL
jgi:hypothetical protein